MPISFKVNQDIQFLNDLDPNQYSVGLKGNDLTKVGKRSTLRNFFSWVIYIISLTLIPRNRQLDQITRTILKDIQDEIGNATASEKDLAEKAISNLNAVIKNNGGSEGAAVDKMLATIAKIQGLPDVQKLAGNAEDPENELAVHESTDAEGDEPNPSEASEDQKDHPVSEYPKETPKSDLCGG